MAYYFYSDDAWKSNLQRYIYRDCNDNYYKITHIYTSRHPTTNWKDLQLVGSGHFELYCILSGPRKEADNYYQDLINKMSDINLNK